MAVILGSRITDSITGFSGIAMSRTVFMNGCVHVGVQQDSLIEAKVPEPAFFNELLIKENDPNLDTAKHPLLGQIVTDTITGIKGTSTAISSYYKQSSRITIQPKGSDHGKPLSVITADIEDIDVYQKMNKKTQYLPKESKPAGPGISSVRPSNPQR